MNDCKPGDLAFSVSRVSSTSEGDKIRINIEDRVSGAGIEAYLDPSDFARAITGLSSVYASQRRAYRLDKWGQRAEYQHVAAKVPAGMYSKDDRDAFARSKIVEMCPEGYTYSHGGWRNDGSYHMTFVRWVAPS